MRIGIIGAGKVGWTIGKYFRESGGISYLANYELAGYYNRTVETARAAAAFTGSHAYESVAALVEDSDLIFIAVSDGAIAEVFNDIVKVSVPVAGKFFFHTSGSCGSEIFGAEDVVETLGVGGVGSAHPLFAISDKEQTWQKMAAVYWTIEGTKKATAVLKNLFAALGNPVAEIAAERKPLYHAASAIVSNLVVAEAFIGEQLYRECGLPEDFAAKAWRSLFIDNAANIADKGVVAALTGPIERGDAATVKKHLDTLADGDYLRAYIELSKALLKVASLKHPERTDAELIKLLDRMDKS